MFLLEAQQALAVSISQFNPISHWTCDETGGIRYDSNTTSHNDLTDNNTVGSAIGLLGNACDFESSSDQYLSITDGAQTGLDLSGVHWMINYWVEPESLVAQNVGIISKGEFNVAGYMAGYANGTYENIFVRQGTATGISGATPLTTSDWVMVTFKYDGTNLKLYVNATLDTAPSAYSDHGDSTFEFNIGRDIFNPTRDYDGLLDEVTIFQGDYTDADITTLYNGGTPLPYTDPMSSTTATTTNGNYDGANFSEWLLMCGVFLFFISYIAWSRISWFNIKT